MFFFNTFYHITNILKYRIFSAAAKKKPKVQFGKVIYTDDDASGTPYEPSEDEFDDDSTLPSDMDITEPDSLEDEEVGDDVGMYQKTLYDYHKEAFYKAYTPYFNSVSNTHLITQEKYNEVKEALLQPKQPKEPQLIRKWRGQYSVGNNIDGRCLYRDGLVVVTFEEVFDVIREAHTKISHMMDPDKNKKVINDDLGYHGVPKSCVQFFIDTCPLVSKQCYYKIVCQLIHMSSTKFKFFWCMYL